MIIDGSSNQIKSNQITSNQIKQICLVRVRNDILGNIIIQNEILLYHYPHGTAIDMHEIANGMHDSTIQHYVEGGNGCDTFIISRHLNGSSTIKELKKAGDRLSNDDTGREWCEGCVVAHLLLPNKTVTIDLSGDCDSDDEIISDDDESAVNIDSDDDFSLCSEVEMDSDKQKKQSPSTQWEDKKSGISVFH